MASAAAPDRDRPNPYAEAWRWGTAGLNDASPMAPRPLRPARPARKDKDQERFYKQITRRTYDW